MKRKKTECVSIFFLSCFSCLLLLLHLYIRVIALPNLNLTCPQPPLQSPCLSIPAHRILTTLGYQLSVTGIYSPGRTGTVTVTRSKVTSLEAPVSALLQLYQLSVYMPASTSVYLCSYCLYLFDRNLCVLPVSQHFVSPSVHLSICPSVYLLYVSILLVSS